jgi:hypothetical protein
MRNESRESSRKGVVVTRADNVALLQPIAYLWPALSSSATGETGVTVPVAANRPYVLLEVYICAADIVAIT